MMYFYIFGAGIFIFAIRFAFSKTVDERVYTLFPMIICGYLANYFFTRASVGKSKRIQKEGEESKG